MKITDIMEDFDMEFDAPAKRSVSTLDIASTITPQEMYMYKAIVNGKDLFSVELTPKMEESLDALIGYGLIDDSYTLTQKGEMAKNLLMKTGTKATSDASNKASKMRTNNIDTREVPVDLPDDDFSIDIDDEDLDHNF